MTATVSEVYVSSQLQRARPCLVVDNYRKSQGLTLALVVMKHEQRRDNFLLRNSLSSPSPNTRLHQ